MDWTSLIPTAVLALALYLGRSWIKAGIEKSVQHGFDTKIETLRAELRSNEEKFKSELRTKESEISALRDGVLSGRANRQALLDARRIEAVEHVWKAVVELAPYKFVSASMAVVKFDAIAEEVPRNPNARKIFEIIGKGIPGKDFPSGAAKNEQPFVSAIAWAYFSAYQAILGHAYLQAKVLSMGLEDAGKIIDTEKVGDMLKTALPHMTKYIDEHGSSGYHYLLDDLEAKLLTELRGMLEGKDIDAASVEQSAKIMNAVEKVRANSVEISKAQDIETTKHSKTKA